MRSRNREQNQLNVVGLSFRDAFMATMGFYTAQFVATVLGLLFLGTFLGGISLLGYWLLVGGR